MTKRLLFVILAACAIGLLAMVGVAGADGGPHGGYTPTTDGCAGCHRAHTADAPRLLTTPVATLCLSCHAAGATGADTNVDDGVYLSRDSGGTLGTVGLGLKGGGFTFAVMDTNLDGADAAAATTSVHTHDATPGTAWGNGAGPGAGAAGFTLECTNCHDPHGNGNYRILRPIPTDSGAAVGVAVLPDVIGDYTVTDADGQYLGEGYTDYGNPASSATTAISAQYVLLSDWCSACHTRYLAPVEGATTDSGDAIFAYRHAVADATTADCDKCHTAAFVIPPPITFDDGQFRHSVECATCHVAHGTSASMTSDGPYSSTVEWPDGTAGPGTDARSSLLRVDNRGVCQACHNK